jgi:hypothetical protein
MAVNLTRFPSKGGGNHKEEFIMKKVFVFTVMLVGIAVLAYSQSPSGTYRCGNTRITVTFSGKSFNGAYDNNTPMSGTFTVSGNKLTLNITTGPKAKNKWVWTIVDANNLRDHDGDRWTKTAGTASNSSASPAASSFGNWVSGEVSILGIGARYERMLNDKMSIGGNVYYNTLFFLFGHDFEAAGVFRYYPWGGTSKAVKGLFFGGGLGFHMRWGELGFVNWLFDTDLDMPLYGVAISFDVGWKLDVGRPGGFFLQPGIKFPVILGARKTWESGLYTDTKYHYEFDYATGTVAYLGLGYAF